jgi:hypothetical protein
MGTPPFTISPAQEAPAGRTLCFFYERGSIYSALTGVEGEAGNEGYRGPVEGDRGGRRCRGWRKLTARGGCSRSGRGCSRGRVRWERRGMSFVAFHLWPSPTERLAGNARRGSVGWLVAGLYVTHWSLHVVHVRHFVRWWERATATGWLWIGIVRGRGIAFGALLRFPPSSRFRVSRRISRGLCFLRLVSSEFSVGELEQHDLLCLARS